MPKPTIQPEIAKLRSVIEALESKTRNGFFNEATQEYERFDPDQHDLIQKAINELEHAKQFLVTAQNW